MRRRTFLVGAAALGTAAVVGRSALADSVSDQLDAIAKARASVKTLVGQFTQERAMGLLATSMRSTGELTLVRPDRLRWELKPPDAVTYWITPQGFAFATPNGSANAGKSAYGQRFGEVLDDLMTLLGGDLNKLRARYEFSVPSPNVLVATPTAPAVKKLVKRLKLTAGPELWQIKEIVIEEQNDDSSVITFTKLERDVKVDPAKMQPPPK